MQRNKREFKVTTTKPWWALAPKQHVLSLSDVLPHLNDAPVYTHTAGKFLVAAAGELCGVLDIVVYERTLMQDYVVKRKPIDVVRMERICHAVKISKDGNTVAVVVDSSIGMFVFIYRYNPLTNSYIHSASKSICCIMDVDLEDYMDI